MSTLSFAERADAAFARPNGASHDPAKVRAINDLHALRLTGGAGSGGGAEGPLKIDLGGTVHTFTDWTVLCAWVKGMSERVGGSKVRLRDERIALGHICNAVRRRYRAMHGAGNGCGGGAGNRTNRTGESVFAAFVDLCGLHERTIYSAMRVAAMFGDDQGRFDTKKLLTQTGDPTLQHVAKLREKGEAWLAAANRVRQNPAAVTWRDLVLLSHTGERANKSREERVHSAETPGHLTRAARPDGVHAVHPRSTGMASAVAPMRAGGQVDGDRVAVVVQRQGVPGAPGLLPAAEVHGRWAIAAGRDAERRTGPPHAPLPPNSARAPIAAVDSHPFDRRAGAGRADVGAEHGRARVQDVSGQMFIGDMLAEARSACDRLMQMLDSLGSERLAVAGEALRDFVAKIGGVVKGA